tara:strand:- start:2408 stop:2620 length:213 start_codon:yes stop_codon:yes gene_type:complete
MTATKLLTDLKKKLLIIIEDDKLNNRKRQCQFLLDVFCIQPIPSQEFITNTKELVDSIIKKDNIDISSLK